MLVTEQRNEPHVIALADGSALRLGPRCAAEIADCLVSRELRAAERMGLVALSPSIPCAPPRQEPEQEPEQDPEQDPEQEPEQGGAAAKGAGGKKAKKSEREVG
jgi:hypothetical protein